MKKNLYVVKWLITGTSTISGRDEKEVRQQFETYDFVDLISEIEESKIVSIEQVKKI